MKLPEIKPINFSNKIKDDVPEKFIHSIKQPLPTPENNNIANTYHAPVFDKKNSEQWNITELENFFKNTSLPVPPVKLNPWSTIIDISLFIDSHIAVIKENNGNPYFKPYYYRLIEFKRFLLLNLN